MSAEKVGRIRYADALASNLVSEWTMPANTNLECPSRTTDCVGPVCVCMCLCGDTMGELDRVTLASGHNSLQAEVQPSS